MIRRRAFVIGGVQAAAGLALVSRLYYLQFVRGEARTLAAELFLDRSSSGQSLACTAARKARP
jgi:hypothetical protein